MEMEPGESIRQSFGARLRALRDAKGLSADGLAKLMGVHRNTVFGLERGERWIGADMLEKACSVLGVHPSELFPTPETALSDERRKLLDLARTVDEAHVGTLLAAFEGFLGPLALLSERSRESK
jgi:transcriptional regulator with XRE-family HTH domain